MTKNSSQSKNMLLKIKFNLAIYTQVGRENMTTEHRNLGVTKI